MEDIINVKELERKMDEIYSISCCTTEDENCETCKEKYGNLNYCPKGYADDIRDSLNMINKSLNDLNKIYTKIEENENE